MKNFNLSSELKWVFLSNGKISLTEAIRLLNIRIGGTVDRDDFICALEQLVSDNFIEMDKDSLWRKVK